MHAAIHVMLHNSALKIRVGKGRQVFRYSSCAHFYYCVGGKHCKCMVPYTNIWGDTLGGHILNSERCESKIPAIKFLLIHSVCLHKIMARNVLKPPIIST